MKKSKYTEPWIKVMRVIPEGETCGVPVYFSVPGPGVAGAKQHTFDDMDEGELQGNYMNPSTDECNNIWE